MLTNVDAYFPQRRTHLRGYSLCVFKADVINVQLQKTSELSLLIYTN